MKCSGVMAFLEQRLPIGYAEGWDNCGLLVGDKEKEIHKIYVAVDATDEVIEKAVSVGADMLITHHPLIFSGLRSVNEDDFIGKRVRRLIREDICYYAMHTNFDIAGDMAGLVAENLPFRETQVLTETADGYGLGRIGNLERPMSVQGFLKLVKEKLDIPHIVLYGDEKKIIERVAIMPGSGKSEIGAALMQRAELMVTGDIGHHEGIDTIAQGMIIADAGHYGLEKVFVGHMTHMLTEAWEGKIQVAAEEIKQPFTVI